MKVDSLYFSGDSGNQEPAMSTPDVGNPGSWKATQRPGCRDSNPVMSGRFFDRGASQYAICVDDELLTALKKVGPFRTNVDDLSPLVRFRVETDVGFPLMDTSFGTGVFLHYDLLVSSGQLNLARSWLGLLFTIENNYRTRSHDEPKVVNASVKDDFVRKSLVTISKWAYPRVFSKGPAYMMFMHWELVGAKSPWDEELINSDIDAWVSGKGEANFELLKPYIDKVLSQWGSRYDSSRRLSFRQYCNDFMRWGTAGGARKTRYRGHEYRSKWAWALSRIIKPDGSYNEDVDLYEEALKEPSVCRVALKEEEKKTREIITTPMASYLRQSYLLYCRPSIPDDSPIANPTWLGNFQDRFYTWYGCADAERFDHWVPKQAVKYIITKVGDIDEETRWVAAQECESMDNLRVVWGDKEWPYKGGLLSGWRVTTLVGTLLSLAIGAYIIETRSLVSAKAVGSGDDIALASTYYGLSREELCKAYAETGFKINLAKTISGPVGEFLRQTYSPRGVFGYPGSAMGSVLYAPPWLERYELDAPQEVSSGWLTLYSRYLPHTLDVCSLTKKVKKYIKMSVQASFGRISNLDDWLATPISAGGGGPIEWSDFSRWSSMTTYRDGDSSPLRPRNLAHLLGVDKDLRTKVESVKRVVTPLDTHYIRRGERGMHRVWIEWDEAIPVWVNKTMFFANYDAGLMSTSQFERALEIKIPRGIRLSDRPSVLAWVMGVRKQYGAFCSVQTTSDALGIMSSFFKNVYRTASSNRRFCRAADASAVATLHAMEEYKDHPFVSGTW